MLNKRENNDGMNKYQFLLILSQKQTLNIEFDASYKRTLTRYCPFPSTSYCPVINGPLSYGTAIKEGDQTKKKKNLIHT